MVKDIVTTVYTFEELQKLGDKQAIERAADWLRQGIVDGDWYDITIDEWKRWLSAVGFEDAKIAFSGFSSQGDGASFTSDVDVAKLATFLAKTPAATEGLADENDAAIAAYVVHKLGGWSAEPKLARVAWLVNYLSAKVTRTSHHYCHYNTCDFASELTGGNRKTERVESLCNEFDERAELLREHLSKEIYRDLQTQYDYLQSDESIAEFAEANEYTFTSSGVRFG